MRHQQLQNSDLEPPVCEAHDTQSKYKLGLFHLQTELGGVLIAARSYTFLFSNLNLLQVQKEDTDILRKAYILQHSFNILSYSC